MSFILCYPRKCHNLLDRPADPLTDPSGPFDRRVRTSISDISRKLKPASSLRHPMTTGPRARRARAALLPRSGHPDISSPGWPRPRPRNSVAGELSKFVPTTRWRTRKKVFRSIDGLISLHRSVSGRRRFGIRRFRESNKNSTKMYLCSHLYSKTRNMLPWQFGIFLNCNPNSTT